MTPFCPGPATPSAPSAPRAPLASTAFILPLLLVLLLFPTLPAVAQQTLADADWSERQLGAGVVWRHYLFDNLFGFRQSISYIEADLSNPAVVVDFPYLESSRQRISAMVPAQVPGAVGAVNGTYFATGATGGHLTYLRINGSPIPPGGALFSPWGYEGAIAKDALGNETIQSIPPGGWANDLLHPDILACGPLVIVDGTVPSAYLASIGAHCTNRHPRSAVGITADNRLILLTVDGRTDMSAGATCEELGLIMDQLGCEDAMNLDGGGSSTLWGAGEPFNGVLNYPSDNGAYDHVGERACSNAISISSTPASPVQWDARLTQKVFNSYMEVATTQSVSLVYKNLGTGTWTASDTRVVLARPESRTSPLQHGPTWLSPSQPALMTPAAVAPGESATFTFILQAPALSGSAVFDEHFLLTRTGTGRIGPSDSEAWMRIGVQTPVEPQIDFIVESRIGGQNAGWYSDSGMADVSISCTAPGCTPGIGMRYGSTYRSVAGKKRATVAPDFPVDGYYNVYVAWGAGASRRSPVTYHIYLPETTHTVQLDQTTTANTWVRLGTKSYYFEKGLNASVVMTNEDIDVSGNMFAGAVKFEYVVPPAPEKSYEVRWRNSGQPVIDGAASVGEWDAASLAGTGFVRHDSPLTSAVEDATFRMLYDDTHLFMLYQMKNAYLPGFPTPAGSYGYFDLGGDKLKFFLTPFGVNSPRFYRILFSPNPTDGVCYVWSQASVVKTTSATAGTDWQMRGGAASTYDGNRLNIEYRIPWTAFNYPGIDASSPPEDGAVWGIQPAITNQLSAGNFEYVNWEPDETPSYIYGEPLGQLLFRKVTSSVPDWSLY